MASRGAGGGSSVLDRNKSKATNDQDGTGAGRQVESHHCHSVTAGIGAR